VNLHTHMSFNAGLQFLIHGVHQLERSLNYKTTLIISQIAITLCVGNIAEVGVVPLQRLVSVWRHGAQGRAHLCNWVRRKEM
jgi:hypothetical protein